MVKLPYGTVNVLGVRFRGSMFWDVRVKLEGNAEVWGRSSVLHTSLEVVDEKQRQIISR